MSRCNAEYTRNYVLMNQREQRAFSDAIVEAGVKSKLTDSERTTLAKFEDVWDEGRDFTEGKTFDWFLRLCERHHIAIRFMRKPKRRTGGGAMVEVTWSKPDPMGSFWPPFKVGGKKRSVEELRNLKAKFRLDCKLDAMKRLGISSLDYRRDLANLADRLDQLEAKNQPAPAPTPVTSNVVRLPVRRVESDLFTMAMADILALTMGEAA